MRPDLTERSGRGGFTMRVRASGPSSKAFGGSSGESCGREPTRSAAEPFAGLTRRLQSSPLGRSLPRTRRDDLASRNCRAFAEGWLTPTPIRLSSPFSGWRSSTPATLKPKQPCNATSRVRPDGYPRRGPCQSGSNGCSLGSLLTGPIGFSACPADSGRRTGVSRLNHRPENDGPSGKPTCPCVRRRPCCCMGSPR